MIGHHSATELAAASFVNNMINLAIIFSTGFSYGLTPVVGSLFGQGRNQEVGRTLKNSIFANTILAVIVCAAMIALFLNVQHLGQPEELLPYIKPYLAVLIISLPFVLWFNAFKQFTDGITDTKVSMWILLGGNILNILGNYILIYGKLGMPEMGLVGAGISTLVSRILMVVVYLILFFSSSRYTVFRQGFFHGASTNRTCPAQQVRMAHCRTDGNGNSFIQSKRNHGRMARQYGTCVLSGHDCSLTGLLHDVLWYGSSRFRTHQ